jgi:predicted RNA-binding protein
MCDLKAYFRMDGGEKLLLESVNYVLVQNGEVMVRNMFGEEKKVRGEVREVSLIKNRIVIEQA